MNKTKLSETSNMIGVAQTLNPGSSLSKSNNNQFSIQPPQTQIQPVIPPPTNSVFVTPNFTHSVLQTSSNLSGNSQPPQIFGGGIQPGLNQQMPQAYNMYGQPMMPTMNQIQPMPQQSQLSSALNMQQYAQPFPQQQFYNANANQQPNFNGWRPC